MKATDMLHEGEHRELPTSTSTSLLEKAADGDSAAWERMVRLYFPLVYGWCARQGLQPEDCVDLAQDVFVAVSRNVHRFDKTGDRGGFRGWLRTITQNKLTDHWRRRQRQRQSEAVGGRQAREFLSKLPSGPIEDNSNTVDPDDKLIVFRAALELIRGEFEPRTWDAF